MAVPYNAWTLETSSPLAIPQELTVSDGMEAAVNLRVEGGMVVSDTYTTARSGSYSYPRIGMTPALLTYPWDGISEEVTANTSINYEQVIRVYSEFAVGPPISGPGVATWEGDHWLYVAANRAIVQLMYTEEFGDILAAELPTIDMAAVFGRAPADVRVEAEYFITSIVPPEDYRVQVSSHVNVPQADSCNDPTITGCSVTSAVLHTYSYRPSTVDMGVCFEVRWQEDEAPISTSVLDHSVMETSFDGAYFTVDNIFIPGVLTFDDRYRSKMVLELSVSTSDYGNLSLTLEALEGGE